MAIRALIAAVGFAASAFASTAAALTAAYALAGFGAGWVFPAISTQAANAVGPAEQGRTAGSVLTALGLGAMLGLAIGDTTYGMHGIWPLHVGCALQAIPIVCGGLRWASSRIGRPSAH